MSINALVVHETWNARPTHDHDSDVWLIGDILPFVLSKYGIDWCDSHLAATQDAPLEYDFSI